MKHLKQTYQSAKELAYKANVKTTGVILVGVTSLQANADSAFPATEAATFSADMILTNADVMSWAWGIFPVVALGWFAFNNSKKAAGKFGAR